jgi:phage-related protein
VILSACEYSSPFGIGQVKGPVATHEPLLLKRARYKSRHPIKRRWRDYRTEMGRRPVKEFLDELDDIDAAAVAAAMKDVRETGLVAARHLRGDIYEVRADGNKQIFRILFAAEGEHGHVLLSLSGFSKKSQKTPPQAIALAEGRLRNWRSRASQS